METDSRARTPEREKGDLNGGKPRSDLKKLEAVMKKQVKWSREKVRKMVTGNASKRIRDHIMENESHPKFIKFNDKLAFTFGVLNICASQHFLLNKSDDFWMWYSIMLPLLMVARFRNFKKQGYQYFMLDFCYFTQLCTFLMMYVVRGSPELFKTVFIYANGPLTFAILAWRNSLVFHDYEKMTSVFIHLLPCMLTYSLRWHVGNDPAFAYAQQPLQWADLMRACLGYSFWQAAYYAKTEVWDKSKLDSDPSLSTSLRYLSGDKKNALARTILKALRVVGVFAADEEYDSSTPKTKMVFMASQFVYTLVTFTPTPFLYYSSVLHLIYIILIFSSAVFYGAGYYIEIFSSRYQLQFENKAKMQKVAETAAVAAYNLANANRMAYEAASASASASSPGGASGTRPTSTASTRTRTNTTSIPPLPTFPGLNRRPNTTASEDNNSTSGTTGGVDDATSAAASSRGALNRPSSLMLPMEDSNASLAAVTAGLAKTADALSRGSSSADMQSQGGRDSTSPVGMSMSTSGLVSIDGQSSTSSDSKQSMGEGDCMQVSKNQQQGAADAEADVAADAATVGKVTASSADRVAGMSTEVASNDGDEATTSEEGEGRGSGLGAGTGTGTGAGVGEATEEEAREAAEEAHWARDVNAEAQAIIAEATSALIDEMMSQHSSSYDDEDMDGEGSGSGRGSGSGGGSDDDHSSSRGRFDSGLDMGMGGDSDDDEHAVEYDFEGDGDIADAGAVDGYDSDRDSFVPHNPHSIVSEDVVYPHDLAPAPDSPTLEAQGASDST